MHDRIIPSLLLSICLILLATSLQAASLQLVAPERDIVISDTPPVELALPDEEDMLTEEVSEDVYEQSPSADFSVLDVIPNASSPPANGSLSPNNKTLYAGIKTDITSSYSDPDGNADLESVYLLLNTSLSEAKGVCLRYDTKDNLVYMRNDAGTGWIGGKEAGSGWTFRNSYASLYTSGVKITRSGNTLTIRWRVVFQPIAAGSDYSAWMRCVDKSGLQANWQLKGSLPIDPTPLSLVPSNVSQTPSSGDIPAEVKLSFQSVYSDPDGAADLAGCHLLLSSDGLLTNAAYFKYDFNANKMYLKDNNDTVWLGGYPAGSSYTVENSFCKLYYADSSVTVSGDTITVNWVFSIKSAKIGVTVRPYLMCWDDGGLYADWSRYGSMKIVKGSTSTNSTPINISLSPNSGNITCESQSIFTAVYSDLNGFSDIANAHLLLNDRLSEAYAAAFRYDAATNRLYVKNDAGTSWLGGYAPGSSNVIENRFCRLFCKDTTVSGSNNTLTVKWAMTLKPIVAGASCMAWIRAIDNAGAQSSYDQMGTYNIVDGDSSPTTNTPPVNISLSPGSGSLPAGTALSFSSVYSDADGYSDLSDVYLLLNDKFGETNAAYFRYDVKTNSIYVRDNRNTTWLGGYPPGHPTIIENSFCAINCANTTVTASGANLKVDWQIMLKPITSGTSCSAWLRSVDGAGAASGWDVMGGYEIP